MDSTLSVLDEAYDKGKRSRASSFNSQRDRAAVYDGLDVASGVAQPLQATNPSNGLPSSILLDPTASFSKHRRQASDVSELGSPFDDRHFFPTTPVAAAVAPSAVQDSTRSPSFHHHNRLVPDNDANSASNSQSPSNVDIYQEPPDLNVAFTPLDDPFFNDIFSSSLVMAEHQQRAQRQQQQPSSLYAAQLGHQQQQQQQPTQPQADHFVSTMDQAYQDMLRKSSAANMPMQFHTNPTFDQNGQPVRPRQSSQANTASFGDSMGLYEDGNGAVMGHYDVMPTDSSFSFSNNNSETPQESSMTANSQRMRKFVLQAQMQPQLRLEVPGGEVYNGSSSLEVPSPYSDSASFDGGSNFGDHPSPSAVDPLALSRTNSFNSQYQPQFDQAHLSAPPSPFPNHESYSSPSLQPTTYSAYPQPVMSHMQQQQQQQQPNYGFLQPQARQGSTQQDLYAHGAGIQIPHSDLHEYGAPDIAIDPPTPSHSFNLARHGNNGFPFPMSQQVPTIMTTSAPSVHGDEQYGLSLDNLRVDKPRGRSHSDTRLMLQPHQPRSHSHSSYDSSSSGHSQSRSSNGLDYDGRRSSSHHRSSKSGHSRRASWSGSQEYLGEETHQLNSKQKNPATFVCPVEGCNKAFTRAYNLRSHQRTHTNERPFLCEVCGKGFARQHDRKRHEKLHTNEKPFSCPGCHKKFARMDALSRHFKSETGKDCIINNPEYQHYLDEEDMEAS